MLEIIVLGQVPGTDWRISFSVFLVLMLVGILASKAAVEYYTLHKFLDGRGQTAFYLLTLPKS